ncbi:RTA1 like protein-domain-containing protein [Fusarium sp. MPI-SDFR-AT-0072]|nr:RTA1 like protein-domain-containing protein [Fusarium sp. MPI-SDFR-AT-0072]
MAGDCGSTCPASDGFYSYNPSVGGNAVLLVVFALLALAAIYFGIRSRTYLFSLALTTGLLLEVLGFVGRILLHSKRDSQGHFFLFLFGTVLGPSLIGVAIFIILPHILGIYGEPLCPFRPLVAGLVFWGLAAVTVLFELIGIVFTAYESNGVTRKQGAAITATGLAIQALSLIACTGLHFWFTLSLSTRRGTLDARHSQVYSSSRFKKFLLAMEMASALLIVYSFYRLVEFADGVSGDVFQNEAAFMVVGGLLPFLAAALLTAIHPGNAFADAWAPTSPRGIKRQSRPTPVQSPTPSGHPVHHLYDPDIRKQISPTSPKHRNSAGPPELPQGSMGLPAHPKPVPRPPSPRDPNAPRKGPPAPLNLAAGWATCGILFVRCSKVLEFMVLKLRTVMPDELLKLVNVFQGLLRAQKNSITATNSNLEAAQIVQHNMTVKVKTQSAKMDVQRSTALSQVRPREAPTNVLALDGRQCGFIDLCPIPKNAQDCLEAYAMARHLPLKNGIIPIDHDSSKLSDSSYSSPMSCSFARISDIINRKLGRGRPSEYDDDEKTRAISITTTITITTTATDSIGNRPFDEGCWISHTGYTEGDVASALVSMYLSIESYKYTPDIDYSLLQLFPVDKLVFILADGFVRLSILAYLPRINRDTSTKKTRAQVIKMTLMLLLGLFAVVSTITRLILLLTTNMNVDITYNSLRVAPFFSLEINSGLWCGCLPAFQPLFEWTNNHYYNHYNMRKLSRSSAQEPLNDSWNRDYMTANPHVSIHGQSRDLKGNKTASDAESTTGFAMLENERGIKLTTEFSVHVEDRVYTGEGSIFENEISGSIKNKYETLGMTLPWSFVSRIGSSNKRWTKDSTRKVSMNLDVYKTYNDR